MKRYIILMVIIVIFFTAGFVGYNLWSFTDFFKNEVSVSEIDLLTAEDGEYSGKYHAGILSAEVRVTVEDHLITDIQIIKHNNGLGKPAEVIIDDVIDKQSLEVELINGASLSSKLILKALENALR